MGVSTLVVIRATQFHCFMLPTHTLKCPPQSKGCQLMNNTECTEQKSFSLSDSVIEVYLKHIQFLAYPKIHA